MSEVSKSLIVTFDALNLVKGIKSIGGPDKQVFYIESDVFAPDRRITPLILQPYLLVEDPHEIIPNGDKISELSSAKWYFDEIKSENRITAKEENASIDTPFALGVNNSLHIRKNVEKAIQLFFEAEYLDIRKNKNIHISLTYLLTTTQSSEVKPAPKLKLSKPQSWKYCPLDKITEATIEAEVFADNRGYKSAVEWCKVEGGKEIPLTDEPFYLGGQNSNKLIVNPSLMGGTLLRARSMSEEALDKYFPKLPNGKRLENLVVNGDFRDKMRKWYAALATYIVNNDKSITILPNQNWGNIQQELLVRPADGELLYINTEYTTEDGVDVRILINGTGNLRTNSYNNYSGLIRFKKATAEAYLVGLTIATLGNFKPLTVYNFSLVNLTAKFGAGNEPAKEECDALFEQYGYIPSPFDLAPDGIIPGAYQSDIKFTKYFPEINAEILFLTGDSIRPEHKTIKAQAIFTTNKEPINNPSEYFDIEWYIDPVEAGGVSKQIGTGEFMEIAVSELPLKGGRLVPIRLKYNFK